MICNMTSGSPARRIIRFSIPLLIGNLLQQLYLVADMAIVSRTLGLPVMAAIGSTGALGFLIFGFYFGLTNGFTVITAQRFGAGDFAGVRRSAAVSTALGGAAAVAGMALFLPLVGWMFRFMHTPEEIRGDAVVFFTILCWGMGATMFYNLLACLIRALGDSWTPLWFLMAATILNIVLDLLFILVFGWGVAAVASAMIISQTTSGLLCLWYIFRHYPMLRPAAADWKFDPAFVWEHLRVALPMACQFSITAIGVVVMQQQVNGFGTATVAAFTAGARIEQLAVQPMFTLGIAVATFTAQNYGAGQIDRVRAGVRQSTLISLSWCVASGIVLAAFSRELVGIFIDTGAEPAATEQARNYIYMTTALFVILGQLFIYRNALQGIGRPFVPMMAGVVELAVRIAASLCLAPLFGYLGAFWATPLAWVGATVLLAAAYFTVNRRLSGSLPAAIAARTHAGPRPEAAREVVLVGEAEQRRDLLD